jgi:hypothetical protein
MPIETSVEVLPENTVYRVGDVVHHTGIKWRRDSIAILTQPKYRKRLLWHFLVSTSRYNGTRLSDLHPAQLQALLERAQDIDTKLHGTDGQSGIILEPSREERVQALARSVMDWLDHSRCTKAPSATSVVHLRLGDKLADMTPEIESRYSLILLRDIATLACTGDLVVLNGVMHFGPISAALQRRFPSMRSTFEFSEAKRARNQHFISTLRSKLNACGVRHLWRSQPSVDEDICFLSTADRFVESIGGYSKLITAIRNNMEVNARQQKQKLMPPNRQCHKQLVRCLGAESVGKASARTLPEVYHRPSLPSHDAARNQTRNLGNVNKVLSLPGASRAAEGTLQCVHSSHVWITVGRSDGAAHLFGETPAFCLENLILPPEWMNQFDKSRRSFWRNRWLLVHEYLQAHSALHLAILSDA